MAKPMIPLPDDFVKRWLGKALAHALALPAKAKRTTR